MGAKLNFSELGNYGFDTNQITSATDSRYGGRIKTWKKCVLTSDVQISDVSSWAKGADASVAHIVIDSVGRAIFAPVVVQVRKRT